MDRPVNIATKSNPATAGPARGILLSDAQKHNWLRLIRSDNVGPATFRDLINHFGSAARALDALPELARRGGAAARIRICPQEKADAEFDHCRKIGAEFVAMGEPGYPPLLLRHEHAPPLLCVKGNKALFDRQAVAIVGSRNASISGLKLASRFAADLGAQEFAIVSGLARGIDASAHKAALESGTIAVFAGGVDVVFPDENRLLAAEIVEKNGTLVSEMPIGWKPRSKDFPRRNRIIAGLAMGVLVVEAARRSGSLITARLANEAGRLVFGVPGSPLDPRSEGTNFLIKQGALLASEARDIVEALAPLDPRQKDLFGNPSQMGESGDENIFETGDEKTLATSETTRLKIINALGPSPVETDDIVRFSNATIGEVQLVLLELSIAGRLERHSGNRISLIG